MSVVRFVNAPSIPHPTNASGIHYQDKVGQLHKFSRISTGNASYVKKCVATVVGSEHTLSGSTAVRRSPGSLSQTTGTCLLLAYVSERSRCARSSCGSNNRSPPLTYTRPPGYRTAPWPQVFHPVAALARHPLDDQTAVDAKLR